MKFGNVRSESTHDLRIILRGLLINSVVALCHCDPHHKFDVKRFKAFLVAAKTEGKAFLSLVTSVCIETLILSNT